jgi:NAD(P)-dependent dehydrogenase (short-subunit alcohol dehydrogenase family)|tara:strand:- start:35 stop:796 length:762 start_codon:yes stop_codon:yes gene_type:complete
MRFKNKGVLITGATGGIGRETCFHFAEEGATVAVTDLDLDLAKRVAEEIKDKGGTAYAYELNVTNQEQTESVIDTSAQDMGSLDIIFCNAGIREIAPAHELSIEEWKNVIDVNVTGVFISAQTFAKHCISNSKPGAIVNTASTLGVMGSTARCAYSTSKHAVVGMTKSLAMDLAAYNIRVNAVGPGVIRTPLTEPYFQDAEMAEKIKQIHAMNRTGLPSEIARAVLFLASDEASFCTGHNLVIDGGWTAGKSM